ncbi:MAG: hypothetical protein GX371_10305 [Bacteroidales bacterium]|nr:hypothetical protein [Bacteroidales bacterium]
MKRKLFFMITTSLLLIAAACSNEVEKMTDPNPYTIRKENFLFKKDMGLYLTAQQERSATYSKPFEIDQVNREGDLLHIGVSFPAGCNDNEFEVIWDGLIMESSPPQTRIFIKRNAKDCTPSDEIKQLTLTVDLNELIFKNGDQQLQSAVVIVSNASKKVSSKEADIPVSSNP